MEVLVPSAGLVYAVSVTAEGSGVPEFAAPAALVVQDVEGDELLDPARKEVRVGTGVVVAMITKLLDHADGRQHVCADRRCQGRRSAAEGLCKWSKKGGTRDTRDGC